MVKKKIKIKAILFDLDNTLIDFMRFKRICCEEAMDAMIRSGLKMSKEKGMKILYSIYQNMEDPTIFQKFLKKTSGEVDYRKLAYAINAYRKARIGVLTPYPGTKKTLMQLKKKGLKLAIVTDAPRIKAWLRLTSMKLDTFFDLVVVLEDTGRVKPSKMPFKEALKKLKLKPSECLMIGDMPHKDIKGARSLGIRTCFAKYGHKKPAKGKWDFEIHDISELVKIITSQHQ